MLIVQGVPKILTKTKKLRLQDTKRVMRKILKVRRPLRSKPVPPGAAKRSLGPNPGEKRKKNMCFEAIMGFFEAMRWFFEAISWLFEAIRWFFWGYKVMEFEFLRSPLFLKPVRSKIPFVGVSQKSEKIKVQHTFKHSSGKTRATFTRLIMFG